MLVSNRALDRAARLMWWVTMALGLASAAYQFHLGHYYTAAAVGLIWLMQVYTVVRR